MGGNPGKTVVSLGFSPKLTGRRCLMYFSGMKSQPCYIWGSFHKPKDPYRIYLITVMFMGFALSAIVRVFQYFMTPEMSRKKQRFWVWVFWFNFCLFHFSLNPRKLRALRVLGCQPGCQVATYFEAPELPLGGFGASIGGVRIVRRGLKNDSQFDLRIYEF